jgi:membrane fusion protein, multidrug efflux system
VVQVDRDVFVFVAEEGHSVRRKVIAGARRDGMVEVLDGLTAGELVITDGIIKVRDRGRIITNLDTPPGRPGAMAAGGAVRSAGAGGPP